MRHSSTTTLRSLWKKLPNHRGFFYHYLDFQTGRRTGQCEISTIVKAPDLKEKLLAQGVDAEGDTSAEFTAYIKVELAKWKKLIEEAKIDKI